MATKAEDTRNRTTQGSASTRTAQRRPSTAAKPARSTKPARAKASATKASRARSSGRTAAMIGVAAAGLATGLLANLGRKVAVQAPSAMTGDWLEAIKAEHKAALALFDALQATDSDQVRRRAFVLMQLKHALSKHAFSEENVIYTALREWGDKADADKLNHDHGYVKQYLYTLENMAKDDPEFTMQVAEFREMIEAHMREEENDIFPRFHAALSEDKNRTLTAAANREGFKLA